MNIPGAQRLTSIFGDWPSFHDAEVVRVVLDRAGASGHDGMGPMLTLAVRVSRYGPALAPDGTYARRDDTRATFRFDGVQELELANFNDQNALWDLELVDIRDRQLEGLAWEVTLAASHGVSARFLCAAASVVHAEPWELAAATQDAEDAT